MNSDKFSQIIFDKYNFLITYVLMSYKVFNNIRKFIPMSKQTNYI